MRVYVRTTFWIIIAVLIVLKFSWLELDPPYFFKGYSTAHLTDPHHLTFFARNAVLFGDWNPFDFHRWDIFKYSIVSGMSYPVFLIGGVSRLSANLTAVILSLGGIFLFWGGFKKGRSFLESALVLSAIMFSSMLFFYGRLPFLENGVILFSGLLAFVFMQYHRKPWGQAVCGILIAAAMLHGKLFAVSLMAPVVMVSILYYRRESPKPVFFILGGFLLYCLAFFLLFLQGSPDIIKQYYLEQTVGMYGAPEGLISLFGFIEQFVTYGSDSGFVRFSPFLIVLGGAGMIVFLLTNDLREKPVRENLVYHFCFFWIIFGILALVPFNYRPMRYAIYLYLPIAAMGIYPIALVFQKEVMLVRRVRPEMIVLLILITWYLLSQVYLLAVPHHEEIFSGISAMPFTFIGSLVIVTGIVLFIKKARNLFGPKLAGVISLVFLAGYGINQSGYLHRGLSEPGYDLRKISEEIGEIAAPEAVLTGPYAPTLLMDNNLRGVIYHFGLAYMEEGFFDKIPISHIVADRPNWEMAVEDYPRLAQAARLAEMPLRDFAIGLFRVNDAKVPTTDFERGAIAMRKQEYDSAAAILGIAAGKYPENIIVLTKWSDACLEAGKIEQCLSITDDLAAKYPDNLRVLVHCGKMYMGLFNKTRNQEFLIKAEEYSQKALEMIPE